MAKKIGSIILTGLLVGAFFMHDAYSRGTIQNIKPSQDFSKQSVSTIDDASARDRWDEESKWIQMADYVWYDTRTDLYWSNVRFSGTNIFDMETCQFFKLEDKGKYSGRDQTCGDAINYCGTLVLDADGDGKPEKDWYLPTQKELMQAYLDGIYNQTNAEFATTYGIKSSTEYYLDSDKAWVVGVATGMSAYYYKNNVCPLPDVRCVRRDAMTVDDSDIGNSGGGSLSVGRR